MKCDELKAIHAFDAYKEYTKTGNDVKAQVYLKSEVDAAIVELKDENLELLVLNRRQANAANELRNDMERVIRHQKRKRCLAMANWCENCAFSCSILKANPKFYRKWANRWFALADKFGEGDE